MKFRALLGDRFIDVEAESEEEAQNLAFAKAVRDIRPQDLVVWQTGDHDDWRDIEVGSG